MVAHTQWSSTDHPSCAVGAASRPVSGGELRSPILSLAITHSKAPRLCELADGFLHFFQNLARLDQSFHPIVVRIERSVDFQMSDVLANNLARLLRAFTRRELPEVQSLRAGHELDAEDAVGVVE